MKNNGYIIQGRRGIAPTWNCTHILRKCIKSFNMHKTFYYNFFFLYLIYSLVGDNRNKIHPRQQRSNFKKVGAIPSVLYCTNFDNPINPCFFK